MNDEANSPLNAEFAAAADNPQAFDFGFVEARLESGLANFGFDPAAAAELRNAEIERMRENEGEVFYDEDEGWPGDEDEDDDFEDTPLDDLDDEDDDYDRFSDPLDLDDDDYNGPLYTDNFKP